VLVKTKKKTSAPKPNAKAKASQATAPANSGSQPVLGGNAAKLLQHLDRVLNSNDFTEISQTAVGQEIGIPMGSMTAATKKLLETGRIIAGPNGGFKLANSQQSLGA
jgi:hypothetical protein